MTKKRPNRNHINNLHKFFSKGTKPDVHKYWLNALKSFESFTAEEIYQICQIVGMRNPVGIFNYIAKHQKTSHRMTIEEIQAAKDLVAVKRILSG